MASDVQHRCVIAELEALPQHPNLCHVYVNLTNQAHLERGLQIAISAMSMHPSPAVHMAPLYLRSLYQAMQPGEGWDALDTQVELTIGDLRL